MGSINIKSNAIPLTSFFGILSIVVTDDASTVIAERVHSAYLSGIWFAGYLKLFCSVTSFPGNISGKRYIERFT